MDLVESFKMKDPLMGQYGVRTKTSIKAYTVLHGEQPIVTVTCRQLSKERTEQWLFRKTETSEYLHPAMQCVFFITSANATRTPEATFRQFTEPCGYQFTPVSVNDQYLADSLYLPLAEFQAQFQCLCAQLKPLSPSPSAPQSTTHVRLLLRLMVEWSFFVQSKFTDQRLAYVVCADLISYINHSCAPNCFIVCDPINSWHVELVALRDLAKGEEITISYESFTPYTPRAMRQACMQTLCLFQCRCKACLTQQQQQEAPPSPMEMFLNCIHTQSDREYVLALIPKTLHQTVRVAGTLNAADRHREASMLVRYKWELLKLVFGRARTTTVDHWSLDNVQPYLLFALEAVETTTCVMLELGTEQLIVILGKESLYKMLTLFHQMPNIVWHTRCAVQLLIKQMEDEPHNALQHESPQIKRIVGNALDIEAAICQPDDTKQITLWKQYLQNI